MHWLLEMSTELFNHLILNSKDTPLNNKDTLLNNKDTLLSRDMHSLYSQLSLLLLLDLFVRDSRYMRQVDYHCLRYE